MMFSGEINALKRAGKEFILSRRPAFRRREYSAPRYYINQRTAISDKFKFVYCRVPKAANSTISLSLAAACGFDILGSTANDAKSWFRTPDLYSSRGIEGVIENYHAFTAVRNPYARIFSCYMDKIVRKKPQYYQVSRSLSLNSVEISFDQFLFYLENFGLLGDAHWVPQVDVTYIPISSMHTIAKVENLERDFLNLSFEIFGSSSSLKNWRGNSTDSSRDLHLVSDSDKSRIYKLYEKDFDLLGYPRMDKVL